MQKKRALVVEDEFQIGLEIQTTLSDAGFDVVGPVLTVEEALQKSRKEYFHVAILDANLDGQSVGAIAQSLTGRGVPFVVVSGYAREHLPLALAHAPLLAKPFEGAVLVAAVHRLCSDSAWRRSSPALSWRLPAER